jgi:MFS transporter, DHA2 family, glioxin efflux transporter
MKRAVFQTVGGAFFIAAGQSAFVNTLLKKLESVAPSVNPALVIATGATEIRNAFPAEEIGGILTAYMAGVKMTFVLVIAGAGAAFFTSFGSRDSGGWKSVLKESPNGDA